MGLVRPQVACRREGLMRLLIATTLLAFTSTAMAETWTVDDDGPADFDNIQAAVDAATNGDEIVVSPGTYGSGNEDVVLVEWENLWIHSSEGAAVTFIDGDGKRRGVNYYRASGTLEGFTIRNCYKFPQGAGIWTQGSSPTINQCVIINNTSGDGGGISCSYSSTNSSPLIQDCVIRMNVANNKGGGVYFTGDGGNMRLINTIVSENVSPGNGGGIFNINPGTIVTGCTITANQSGQKGGGLYNSQHKAYIGQCSFSDNIAISGGAAFCEGTGYFSDNVVCENAEPQMMGDWIDGGGNDVATECGGGACCTANSAICVMATESDCLHFGGTFMGWGSSCEFSYCPTSCLGDINVDGEVSTNDLLTVIANWGPCP
jgi:hypothetical protein